MNGRFLIDECLSPALVATAKARNFEADHVTYIGKAGWQDWNLVPFAVAHDYVIVTNNRRDFLKEYAKFDLHGGLVILIPFVHRDQQIALFDKVLDLLAERNSDIVNRLVEVLADGTVHLTDWSSNNANASHVDEPKWR